MQLVDYLDVFLSRNMYVQFPKSTISSEDSGIQIVYTKILNTKLQEVYYVNLNNKGISLRLYNKQLIIYQQKNGKFNSQQHKKVNIEGYKCGIQFSKINSKGLVRIIGHEKVLIQQSQFKGRQITKIKSSIPISQKFPQQIGIFELDFIPNKIKQIVKGIHILYNNEEIWLVKFIQKQKYLSLSVFGKFHYDNQEYIEMKNRLPTEDYQNQTFLSQFNKIYQFKDIQILKIEEVHYQLLILYHNFLLILEVYNMAFRIQQVIKPEFEIENILDVFQPGKAYIRTKNTLYLLSKQTSTYELLLVEELNDDIVLATQANNWEYASRIISLGQSLPKIQSSSRLLIKSLGEVEIQKKDLKSGQLSTSQMYL